MAKKVIGSTVAVNDLKKTVADLQRQLADMKTAAAIRPPAHRELYAGVPKQFADQGKRQVTAVIAAVSKPSSKRQLADTITEMVGEPIAALMFTAQQQAARANAVEELLVAVVDAVGHWPMNRPDVAELATAFLAIKKRTMDRRQQAERTAQELAKARAAEVVAAAKGAEVAPASSDDKTAAA